MNKQSTSKNQELFLSNHRKHHRFVALTRIILFLGFLLLWELASAFCWIDPFFFSSPRRVVLCAAKLFVQQNLCLHIGITLFETLLSFALVLAFSILFAALLWYSPLLSDIAEPYLVILNSLPKSALAPLFIVWLGTGTKTIIIAGMSVAIFGAIISIYTCFKEVEPDKIMLIKTLGGSKKDAFFKVILPSSVPTLLSIMKVNIGLSLVGVIIGEFLAARKGLGYLIIYGSQVFQLDMVITSILILCVIAMLLYQAIQWLEHLYKQKRK